MEYQTKRAEWLNNASGLIAYEFVAQQIDALQLPLNGYERVIGHLDVFGVFSVEKHLLEKILINIV